MSSGAMAAIRRSTSNLVTRYQLWQNRQSLYPISPNLVTRYQLWQNRQSLYPISPELVSCHKI
jgi:hypothetical protein